MTIHAVPRYRGVLAGGLLMLVLGALIGEPWLVALAGVPLAFVVFGAVSGVPDPDLSVEREVEPDRPIPDDRVTVRLTVRNEESTPLVDVRIVDAVPEDLAVVGGDPKAAASIPPGESATVEYELRARRGEHAFGTPQIRVRGTAGGSYRDLEPAVEGDDRIAARVFVDEPASNRETATLVGAVPTETGGSGVEFHTTREYRPGDPMNRIDWRRLARDGELSTVNFREYRGRSIAVVADCRHEADFVPEQGATPAADLCRYAADRMLHAFADAGEEVGLAALGGGTTPWVNPGESDVLARGRAALRATEGEEWDGPQLRLHGDADGIELADRLADRLPGGGQVVFVTSLSDDLPVDVATHLVPRGCPVTVVTPDLGGVESPGARLSAAERRARIERLRAAGAAVVDWSRSEPLPVAVEAAEVGRP